jgi:ribosome-binding protein aMBF1 (putative translation factor)
VRPEYIFTPNEIDLELGCPPSVARPGARRGRTAAACRGTATLILGEASNAAHSIDDASTPVIAYVIFDIMSFLTYHRLSYSCDWIPHAMFRRRSQPRLRIKAARKTSARKILRKAKKSRTSARNQRAGRQPSAKRAFAAAKVRRRRSKRLTAHTVAELPAAIAGARANAGFSQERLADAVKSDQANIVRLEKGRSVPSVRTLLRIAKATRHKLTITFAPLRG